MKEYKTQGTMSKSPASTQRKPKNTRYASKSNPTVTIHFSNGLNFKNNGINIAMPNTMNPMLTGFIAF